MNENWFEYNFNWLSSTHTHLHTFIVFILSVIHFHPKKIHKLYCSFNWIYINCWFIWIMLYVNVEFFFLFCPAQVEWNCYMFLGVPSSGNGKIPQHPKPHVEFGWNYSLRLLNSGHTKWLIYWIIVNKVWLICFQHFFPPLVLGF